MAQDLNMGPPRDILGYIYCSKAHGLPSTVEACEMVGEEWHYSHCNLEGELIPWDMPFDRERARTCAEMAQFDGFHL